MESKKTTQLKAMRMDIQLVETIEKMAEEQNRNFTNMVETLLLRATAQQH